MDSHSELQRLLTRRLEPTILDLVQSMHSDVGMVIVIQTTTAFVCTSIYAPILQLENLYWMQVPNWLAVLPVSAMRTLMA